MESNLLKFNAKNHLLNAGICALATKDLVLVQMKWNDFQDIDYTFGESREGKFLQVCVAMILELVCCKSSGGY